MFNSLKFKKNLSSPESNDLAVLSVWYKHGNTDEQASAPPKKKKL
jgi:hypothetical protein